MQGYLLGIIIFLLATICIGTLWIMLRHSQIECLLAIQLFGTTGVASLVLMAEVFGNSALRDVALVLALLAAILAVAFIKNQTSGREN